jgi:hypothetical protein
MLPAELQALIEQVDACERDAERLVSGMSDDAVNQPPPSGGWSVAQCLEHLALMNDVYLRGWPEAVREAAAAERGPFTGLRPTPIGRWFANSMEPPVKMKQKAPTARPGATRFAVAEILSRYKASHETYRHLVRASATVDVNRVRRQNPFLKLVTMRLATVLMIIPAHDRRHLWQAANVKRAFGAG